ncbi:MAG: hypothetical protein M0Z55_13390 [Peptococcaceae bacterium]|nr:hypothetical protein [Peptococcaceae bacterium]
MKLYGQLATVGAALTIMVVLTGCAINYSATANKSTLQNNSGSIDVTQSVQHPNDAHTTNTTTTNIPTTSHTASNNFMLEQAAKIKLQIKADLFNDGQQETIAIVNLPLTAGQDYSGYLGIWNAKGHLLQKLPLHGYDIMFPVKIYTNDLTQDGKPDLVLETDEHANGGNGAHHVYVYIQKDHYFAETPLSNSPAATFFATYQKNSQTFLIQSQEDLSRSWSAKLNADQMQNLNKNLLQGKQGVQIDPVSILQVANDSIITKRWLWFGNLQLNNLGFLVTHYQYRDGKWLVVQFSIESSGSAQVSQN